MDLNYKFAAANGQKASHGRQFFRQMQRFFLCIGLVFVCSSQAVALDLSDYLNEVSVTSAEADANTATNTSDVQVTPKALTVTKTANSSALSSFPNAGETITYTIIVSNTGLLDLTNVVVTDPLIANLTGPTGDSGNDNVLGVGEIWGFTGSYNLTQADLDTNGGGDGDIDNTVSVVTTEIAGPTEASADVAITQNPDVGVVKDVDIEELSAPGTLSYTIEAVSYTHLTLPTILLV